MRPGADYQWSLNLLKNFKAQHPGVPTKSGIMLGLGEDFEQIKATMRDLRAHDVDMITIGQYLQPTAHHHPVLKYWTPEDYKALEDYGYELGFSHVASGPMVRSSYHADVRPRAPAFPDTLPVGGSYFSCGCGPLVRTPLPAVEPSPCSAACCRPPEHGLGSTCIHNLLHRPG